MNKYAFKPYNKLFPKLFDDEKKRIESAIVECLAIEHIGSTAIPGMGGKGLIDLAIAVKQSDIARVSKKLEALGYIFRESGSGPERWFFCIDLPDGDENYRRYHVHLTFAGSEEWINLLLFRDYLRSHPNEAAQYAKIKVESDQDKEIYRQKKAPFVKDILTKAHSSIFVMIYRGFIDPSKEDLYRKYWREIGTYFVKERGALGVALHKAENGTWVAISKWPSKAAYDALQTSNSESGSPLPPHIQESMNKIKECYSQQPPDIIGATLIDEILP